MLEFTYNNGRGHVQLNLEMILPCSAADMKRIMSFVDLSTDPYEHAKAQITIWKHGKARTVTDEDGNETEKPARMFMKLAYFFTFEQVEPIAARA